MNKYTRRRVLEDAIITYGERPQTQMCIEECSELIKALCKIDRAKTYMDMLIARVNVVEEMADVQIMLDQMRLIYGDTSAIENEKLERLRKNLADEQKAKNGSL